MYSRIRQHSLHGLPAEQAEPAPKQHLRKAKAETSLQFWVQGVIGHVASIFSFIGRVDEKIHRAQGSKWEDSADGSGQSTSTFLRATCRSVSSIPLSPGRTCDGQINEPEAS